MDAKTLVKLCEKLGFGVAHARRKARSNEVRAYVAVKHPNHADVDELRWLPHRPGELQLYQHATKPNGYTQYDKFVGRLTVADLLEK